jgi:hemerythrin
MEPAMPLFAWNDTYSVGNMVFDGHHQKLIQLINQLHEAMLQGKAKQELSMVLTELSNYTRFHFAAEEKEMLACNYPGLAGQKAQHRMFEAKIAQFQAEL